MPNRRTFAPMPMNNAMPSRTGRGTPPAGVVTPPPAQPLPPGPTMGGPPASGPPIAPMGGGMAGAPMPTMPGNLRVPSSVPLTPAQPTVTGSGTGTVNPTDISPFLAAKEGSTMTPQSGSEGLDPHEAIGSQGGENSGGNVPMTLLRMIAMLNK